MKTEKYVGIKLRDFGHGMQTLFEGVAEVFSSIGVEIPETLADKQSRWGGKQSEPDTLVQVPTDDVKAEEDAGEPAIVAKPVDTPEQVEPDTTETPDPPVKKGRKNQTAPTEITVDDITKIIVQKVKQDRKNNAKAEQLLKTYGVVRVSELDPSQYEAFITDLAAL